MLTKNLSSFSNHWLVWSIVATLTIAIPLLNAWLGFPLPATFDGLYSAIGGTIPYSDATGYISGGYHYIDLGFLDSWSMRRPLNALFFAFRLKVANGSFWYVMAIQAGLCIICLTLYLRTLRHDIGTIATGIALIFLYYYAQMYVHTTMSETLGLTLGLLTFVLLWNGWLQRNRLIFNIGIASLAVALSVRAGPNFMVPALFLLVYLDPFTSSRFKDVGWAILAFTIPFILLTKLSTIFGDPTDSGMAFSNFGCVLYGLVNGGKSWLYAYQDPHIQSLVAGKNEAQEARILYEESWKVFKDNPLSIVIGTIQYLGGFCYWFIRQFSFGIGIIHALTTIISVIFWLFIGFRIYIKRYSFKREFLFLTIVFLGIAASSCIIWKDGGIRPFAVAIPFMGALFGLSFASLPPLIKQKIPEIILSICVVVFIVLGSLLSPFIPSRTKIPDISALKADQIPGQEIFLTYTLNKQAHLIIDTAPGFHFRTISPDRLNSFLSVNEGMGEELRKILEKKSLNKFSLICIYDYISHSTKYIVSDLDILESQEDWLLLHGTVTNEGTGIYRVDKFTGVPQK
jgi:hypothetical protein